MARVTLTDRFVAGAKAAGDKRADYFDASTKGLSLLVSPHGPKAWSFNFTSPRDGRRARVGLGSYPATSLATARTRAIEATKHVEDGRDPRDVFAAQTTGAMTVATLIESYLAKHVRPALRSAAAIERRLNKNVLPEIGAVRVAELHRRDVNRVLDPILERGKQTEVGRVFEDLRAAFRWAVQRGDLDHSPMEGMKKPGSSTSRERVLSDDEIRTLWHGLPKSLKRSKTCQRIIKLCLITGQRVGEVAGMARSELDIEARTWALPGARTKNGHAHLVPLSDMAIGIIEEAVTDSGKGAQVFQAGDGSAFPAHAVARAVARAREVSKDRPLGRFGIEPWSVHDLRRTVFTNMAKLGVAPVVAGAVANHVTVTKAGVTLSVYTRYTYDREKRDALELWASRLDAILEGDAATVRPMRATAG